VSCVVQVVRILTSAQGRVRGVAVRGTDEHGHALEEETLFLCSKGLVLATGGFSADVEFRSVQCPVYGEHVMTTNQVCHVPAHSRTVSRILR
jgi:succinate dehydrogenase/fumarate reductase flavoprotein subunit